MIEIKIILIPVIGLIIGAFTNYLALKMLFYPKKKFFGFQGLIPKRKKYLAKSIGQTIPSIMPQKIKNIEKIPVIGKKIIGAFQNSVEKQINLLSNDDLEKIIVSVMKKEMKFVIWIGGIIGFMLGLVQVLLVL